MLREILADLALVTPIERRGFFFEIDPLVCGKIPADDADRGIGKTGNHFADATGFEHLANVGEDENLAMALQNPRV